MAAEIDLSVHALNRQDDRDFIGMPGLYAAQAPFQPARGRLLETLVIHLALEGNAPLPPREHKKLIIHLADIYYKTPGSTTTAMKYVADELNDILIERNTRKANRSIQSAGLLTMVVFREERIYLAQSGPTHAILVSEGGSKHYFLSNLAWRGLGFSRTPNIHFHQMEVAPGDFFLIAENPPQSWLGENLDGMWGKSLEEGLRTLTTEEGSDLQAAVIQISPGTGILNFSQNGLNDQHDGDLGVEPEIEKALMSGGRAEAREGEEPRGTGDSPDNDFPEDLSVDDREETRQIDTASVNSSDLSYDPEEIRIAAASPESIEMITPEPIAKSAELGGGDTSGNPDNEDQFVGIVNKLPNDKSLGGFRRTLEEIPRWIWGLAAFALLLGSISAWMYLSGSIRSLSPAVPTIRTDLVLPPALTDTLAPQPMEEESSTEELSKGSSTSTVTEELPTVTPFPTKLPSTALDIGSTQISPVDGMVLVYVPEGEFVMGGVSDDRYAEDDEHPSHTVYLKGYWIDQTEVTNAQYAQCVDERKCAKPYSLTSFSRSEYFFDEDFANFPVIYVSWYDASAYCEWAGRRLPTEAEWEKAARGDDARIYPWGSDITCNLANFAGCSGDTVEVGSYKSGVSPYGLFDMSGNVWEWVADYYYIKYYDESPLDYPHGPESGAYRVIRGGSWNDDVNSLRTSSRFFYYPDNARVSIGFRCVGISSN